MPSKTERMGEEKQKKKKTGSEEKAKGKSQFCFLHNVFARSSNICSNMLVSEQKAA